MSTCTLWNPSMLSAEYDSPLKPNAISANVTHRNSMSPSSSGLDSSILRLTPRTSNNSARKRLSKLRKREIHGMSLVILGVSCGNDAHRIIEELKNRFAHFVETGDESKIPGGLARIAYQIVGYHLDGGGLRL